MKPLQYLTNLNSRKIGSNEILENGKLKGRLNLTELMYENLGPGATSLIAGSVVSVVTRGLGGMTINPLIYGAAATVVEDFIRYIRKEEKISKRMLRDDVAVFLGQTAGYVLPIFLSDLLSGKFF